MKKVLLSILISFCFLSLTAQSVLSKDSIDNKELKSFFEDYKKLENKMSTKFFSKPHGKLNLSILNIRVIHIIIFAPICDDLKHVKRI